MKHYLLALSKERTQSEKNTEEGDCKVTPSFCLLDQRMHAAVSTTDCTTHLQPFAGVGCDAVSQAKAARRPQVPHEGLPWQSSLNQIACSPCRDNRLPSIFAALRRQGPQVQHPGWRVYDCTAQHTIRCLLRVMCLCIVLRAGFGNGTRLCPSLPGNSLEKCTPRKGHNTLNCI